MATFTPSAVRRKAALENWAAQANSGTIKIYTGTIPSNPETAVSGQTLLGTLTFSSTAFGSGTTAHPSVVTANAITQDSSADATGTAAWARILASDGTTVLADVDVGTSGATINLNTTSIVAGGPISITSFTVSL